jgi:murein DD-endopeptidase MepM/ murein hydrolase activator NlpD
MSDISQSDGNKKLSFLGNTLGITGSGLETLNRASQTISQIGQNQSKSVSDFTQVLAKDKLARSQQLAQTESPFAQLASGLTKGALTYIDNKEKSANEKEALAQNDFNLRQKTYNQNLEARRNKAKADSELYYEDTLREFTNDGLWKTEGGTGFINRISAKLEGNPDLTADVVSSVLTRAYRTTMEYEGEERKQASRYTQELQEKVAETRKTQYMGRAIFITEALRNATNTEQSSLFEAQLQEQVIAPLFADPQLSDIQKYAISASVIEQYNSSLKDKVGAYESTQSAFRQWRDAQPLYQQAYLDFANDGDQVKLNANVTAIQKQYPLSKDFVLPPGEAQRRTNDLLKTQLENAKLTQEERGAYPLQLQNESVRHFVARALLDRSQLPAIREELQNDDTYRLIEKGISEWDAYNARRGELDVTRAQLNTEIAQLSLNSAEDFYRISIQALKTNDSGQLDILRQALALAPSLTPEQRALIETNPEEARNNAAIREQLTTLTKEKRQGIDNIIRAKREELQARYSALGSQFPTLSNFGLFGADTPALQRALEVGRESARVDIENYRNRLLEIRRNQTLNQSLNGQVPNFSQDAPRDNPLTNPAVLGRVRVNINDQRVEILSPIGGNGRKSGTFTSGFGQRWGKMHAGIDIAAPIGTPVVSVVSGTVYETVPLKGYGNIVTIQGDDGFFYRYAHSKPTVAKGQRVQAGDVVAKIDGSGIGTGAHVHMEVRTAYARGGSQYAIDPIPHLQKLSQGLIKGKNIKDVRQNTSAMTTYNVQTASPVVTGGNGNIITGNQVTNIIPNVSNRGKTEPSLQGIGSPTRTYNPIQTQYTRNRPIQRTLTSPQKRSQTSPDENFNYVYLAQNPTFRNTLHAVAQRTGADPQHLADIIFQESKFTPNLDHSQGQLKNVGLVGFDKYVGNTQQIVQMSAVQQLGLLENYINRNIPKQYRDNLATLWAGIRMGTIQRNQFWKNPSGAHLIRLGKRTYADELKMLGREAGREYLVPGYDKRSSSIKPNVQIAYGTGKSTLDAQLGVQSENHMQTFIQDA